MLLTDKTAVISGAGKRTRDRPCHSAAVREPGEARVAILDLDAAAAKRARPKKLGPDHIGLGLATSAISLVVAKRAEQAIAAFGKIDILINKRRASHPAP